MIGRVWMFCVVGDAGRAAVRGGTERASTGGSRMRSL
jgi:hypothetical protein